MSKSVIIIYFPCISLKNTSSCEGPQPFWIRRRPEGFCFDAGAAAIGHLTKENLRLSKRRNLIELHEPLILMFCCFVGQNVPVALQIKRPTARWPWATQTCRLWWLESWTHKRWGPLPELHVCYSRLLTWYKLCCMFCTHGWDAFFLPKFNFFNQLDYFCFIFWVRENTHNCSSQNQHLPWQWGCDCSSLRSVLAAVLVTTMGAVV